MLQPRYGEGSRISIPIKQERLTPAKMRDARPLDVSGESPAGADTILLVFLYAVVARDVLQVGHRRFQLPSLCHAVDEVIQHSHISPGIV